jgi:hypothetical protein
MNGRRHSTCWLIPAVAAVFLSLAAQADNFGGVRYDRQRDQLVVTMIYRGTNPNHKFSLRWGECRANQAGDLPGVTAEILDDQFIDPEEQDFRKTVHFSLAGLPCPHPASVTLRTAPRFFYTLTIPG